MLCPNCGGDNLHVVDTTSTPDKILRKRSCSNCLYSFYTSEIPVMTVEEFKNEWNKFSRYTRKNRGGNRSG